LSAYSLCPPYTSDFIHHLLVPLYLTPKATAGLTRHGTISPYAGNYESDPFTLYTPCYTLQTPSVMSSKRLSHPPSSPGGTRSHRSRESGRDSGVGSLSSDQASSGGKPDRRFTAHDYQDQLSNIYALQEALDRATEKVEHYKKKCRDMDHEVSNINKAHRETKALYRAQCDRTEQLEQELSLFKEQYKELQADYDDLRDRYGDLRQRYATETQPVEDPTMSGAGDRPSRTKSKHGHDDKQMKDRMKDRLNRDGQKDDNSSKSSHRHSRRLSRAPSTSRKPYIEEMPPPVSSKSSRPHSNYKTTSHEPHIVSYASIPRTTQPISTASYPPTNEFQDGNYHLYPLPGAHGRHK